MRQLAFQLTTVPYKQASCERHPLSVSAGCHNCPSDTEPSAPSTVSGLEDIFRAHKSGLFHFFQRRVGHDEATDLVQDVFARAAGSDQRHQILNPGGFLRRIAQNLLIDRSRKLTRNNVVMLPLVAAKDAPSPAEQEYGIDAADMMRMFEAALDSMPEKTRRICPSSEHLALMAA